MCDVACLQPWVLPFGWVEGVRGRWRGCLLREWVDERVSWWMRGSHCYCCCCCHHRLLIVDYKSVVATGYNRSFTGSHVSQNLGNRQPQPISGLGNRNRKSGCHQSGSVGSTVFFWSYAPDFQTLDMTLSNELKILQHLNSEPLLSNPRNHSIHTLWWACFCHHV
jgi:hypothetical protein